MRHLFLIPARGGSKGIPGKNIKLLGGKPLIEYSINYARLFSADENICVSTDDDAIARTVEATGLTVEFKRPPEFSSDTAGAYDVIRHAIDFYKSRGKIYDTVILLQPTSPFREKSHFEEALRLFDPTIDMVVSVIESPYNPYFSLFEEDEEGMLKLSKPSGFLTRQEAPHVYAYNGLIYVINVSSVESCQSFADFRRVRKYVMESSHSVDLDTPDDWNYAEYLINHR